MKSFESTVEGGQLLESHLKCYGSDGHIRVLEQNGGFLGSQLVDVLDKAPANHLSAHGSELSL